MKHKVSISLDEEIILKVRESIRIGRYRNRSHAVEYALRRLLHD